MTNVLLQNQLVNHMNCRSLLFWEIYCMCTLRCKYQICTILLVIFATVNNTNRNSNRPIWIQKRSEHCQTDRIHVWSMVYLPIYISLIFMGFDVGKYTIPHGWYGSHTPIIHINSHGFRLTKPEPGPSTPGQALLGCVSDDPYLFRTFVRVVQPAPRLFWETQILSRLWGFLKNGDIEVTIVCIYIYIFFYMYAYMKYMYKKSRWNWLKYPIPTSCFFLSFWITWIHRGWISTRGGLIPKNQDSERLDLKFP